jgi:hypothetical protein
MTSFFAMYPHDAMSWHDVANELASVAEVSGFSIRPHPGRWNNWQVFATPGQLADLQSQLTPQENT